MKKEHSKCKKPPPRIEFVDEVERPNRVRESIKIKCRKIQCADWPTPEN
jgi:hypothetical protein